MGRRGGEKCDRLRREPESVNFQQPDVLFIGLLKVQFSLESKHDTSIYSL